MQKAPRAAIEAVSRVSPFSGDGCRSASRPSIAATSTLSASVPSSSSLSGVRTPLASSSQSNASASCAALNRAHIGCFAIAAASAADRSFHSLRSGIVHPVVPFMPLPFVVRPSQGAICAAFAASGGLSGFASSSLALASCPSACAS